MTFRSAARDSEATVKVEMDADEIACESDPSSGNDISDDESDDQVLEINPVTEEVLKSVLERLHPQTDVELFNFDSNKAEELARTTRAVTQRTQNWAVKVQYKILSSGHDDQQNLNLVLKFLPPDPFDKYYVTDAGFDLREISFYTEVFIFNTIN